LYRPIYPTFTTENTEAQRNENSVSLCPLAKRVVKNGILIISTPLNLSGHNFMCADF
jgi:hypothetical protein